MVLDRFNISIFIQVMFIAIVGMLLTTAMTMDFMQMTAAGLLVLWIGQILFLNFFMSRIQRDVIRFMEALRNQDTTQFFHYKRTGKYFQNLYALFNEITGNFRLIRIEKEMENQFFRETIKQSASGIMAADDSGNILLINRTALDLLGMDRVSNLNDLLSHHPDLAGIFSHDKPKDHQVKIFPKGKMVHLAVKSSVIKLRDTKATIYSFLDITLEMDRRELEAWLKLIRVLNHEITNSVVPIQVLASSLYEMFEERQDKDPGKEMEGQLMDRTILGLKTIVKRSKGLSEFIDTFRNFTSIDEPDIKSIRVSELFDHVLSLMSGELEKHGVKTSTDISPANLEIPADEKLIEQTLINLMKNSIQAITETGTPLIMLKGYKSDEKVCIEVTDNGKGITAEIIDHVFTPFFTTRKDGSGIGLSLARQVMQMHNGSIRVSSEENGSTTFTLDF